MSPVSNDLRRSLSLVGCFLSGLGSGTLYLYSAYAPQLTARLGLSAVDSSLISMCGNVGMSLSGPIAGIVVDKQGPTPALIIGSILVFLGYSGIRYAYEVQVSRPILPAVSLFFVGIGSTHSFSAVVKCAALNYPDKRGFATSLPLAAFGLSAFFISSLSTLVNSGDTYTMLHILNYLPPFLYLVSIFVVRVLPQALNSGGGSSNEIEMLEASHGTSNPYRDLYGARRERETGGLTMLKDKIFWIYFVILGILSGSGQMYIYSCGYIVHSLVGLGGTDSNDAIQLQRLQVSLISLCSFSGRIASGTLSDYLHERRGLERSWLLVIASGLGIIAQLLGYFVSSSNDLWMVSVAIGISYGVCFGSFPTIVGDSFGMKNFSQNWGIIAMAPVPVSYLFNMLFGAYYDINATYDADGHRSCDKGRECYNSAFSITSTCLAGALLLSILLVKKLSRE